MTIMLQNLGPDSDKIETNVEGNDKEHVVRLPRASYEALAARKLELSSLVCAHILWDNDNCRLVLLGNEESVQQTESILVEYLHSQQAHRRLGGRSLLMRSVTTLSTLNDTHLTSLDEAKHHLLMSQLPPELAISIPGHSAMGHSGHTQLSRTLSDTITGDARSLSNFSRRKLESEDSSYDSDHENILSGPLGNVSNVSKSHEDVTRSSSETLAQEFAEYVSIKPSFNDLDSRELSPISRRSTINQDSIQDISDFDSVDKDVYYQKVEFALKLGYAEELTKKALSKIGFSACNDDLLNELIRLQQSKIVDPNVDLLKESSGETSSTTSQGQGASTLAISAQENNTRIGDTTNSNLRPIVIDGSNVAMSHGNSEMFSCRGIEICVEWFRARGHKDIKVFLPLWRKETSKPDTPISSQQILRKLEKEKVLSYSPSRQVGGKRIVCHDDRFILNLASENGGIVVSNDHYRELINEKKEYKKVIEERILMYTFVDDRFMPPDDPFGRHGPSLDTFLKNPTVVISPNNTQPCPYGKKCTYGNKCKFFHADRGNIPMKTVTDKLKEQSKKQILEVRTRGTSRDSSPRELTRAKSMNLPLRRTESDGTTLTRRSHPCPVSRTISSRPLAYPGSDYYAINKSEISKTNSVDNQPRGFKTRDLRMSSAPIQIEDSSWPNLEMGCLSNYGLQQPSHPGSWAGIIRHPPPTTHPQHRKLERQLTINPSFDPRINKAETVSPGRHMGQTLLNQQHVLSSEAMDYMHRNPPPPFGLVNIAENTELSHQNVTRNASAPDSIKHWGPENSLKATNDTRNGAKNDLSLNIRVDPPLQRLSSGSDTQLNKSLTPVNRAYSADPFSGQDGTWQGAMSPLLGSSIWCSGPVSPPTSPARNLGPVGSRPESRARQYQDLCNIFPKEKVDCVMNLLPNEKDTQVLCKKIIELYPC